VMLTSSLMRAVVFSALATANAFGALWLSTHPGTASMGRLLMIALGWELLVTLLFRPALLARSQQSDLGFQGSWLARPLWSAGQSIAHSPTTEPARATSTN
jgi:hypothetical protein